MSPEQARAHLVRLGLSQQGFARLVRVNPVTMRRWLRLGSIPRSIEILLEILTPDQVARLVDELERKA